MAGQGTLILASDFNALQSAVAQVLGAGSNTYGYGQAVSSSSVSTNGRITVAQWTNLRTDLLKCVQHQTNVDYTSTLVVPTTSTKLTYAIQNAYKSVADYIGPNRLALPAGQATRATLNTAQRTAAWNGTISHTVVVNFTESTLYPGNYNSRFFFNAGGKIEITVSKTAGSGGAKNISWDALLGGIGTITFDYDTTTVSGSGTGSSVGFYDLTTSYQTIYTRALGVSESYYPNKYYIQAKVDNTTTRAQLTFNIIFSDDSGQPNAPWGTDENVDGTITSTVQTYRATGSNVSIPQPTSPASTL